MKLQANDIAVTLQGNPILQGGTVTAGAGELVGIIGPNGSGKSTLLRCIYRALSPQKGAVLLDGTPMECLSPRQTAQKMAVLAQHNHCPFDFTVLEMVLLGRSPHKRLLEGNTAQDVTLARQALEQVGLAALEERAFATLSGGEQQRVLLARALVQQTSCLILDEPTNHLDIQYQLELMDLVRGLGVTVLAAIHDLNIAALYCDRLYVMQQGQVVASGPPAQILTPERIAQVYRVNAQVLTLPGGRPYVIYQPVQKFQKNR